jgi:ribosomal 50S subunit-recycling heat shock protein
MRLDVFLKKCCIVKRRTEAKRACDNGIVTIDEQVAKASRELMAGQRVCIAFTDRLLEFDVLEVPSGNVPRKEASNYFRILRDEIQASEFI